MNLLTVKDQPEWSSCRLAAANIRLELKKRFSEFKFSVRIKKASPPDSITVRCPVGITDGHKGIIRSVVTKYELRTFNVPTGYELNETDFNKQHGGTGSVFIYDENGFKAPQMEIEE